MKTKMMKAMSLLACLFFVFGAMGCQTEEEDALNGVSISGSSAVDPGKTATLKAVPSKSGSITITYTWAITDTDGTGSTLSATEGSSVTLNAGSTEGNVVVTVTATWDSVTVSGNKTIRIGENVISASDTPTGWASYTGTTYFDGSTSNTPADSTKGTSGGYGASSSKIYTVSTRSALQSALSGTDKKIIYINGMIDMTDGMLPASASGSSTALDSWIADQVSALTDTSKYGSVSSSVTSLATWKSWYAAGNTNSADESGVYKTARSKLSSNYGSIIKLNIPSNTTIIGLTSASGIKGGCIKISGKSNIVIRNLFIQDPFDPFPQIEKGDGFNANWDGIEISSSSKYIWIDHCTIQDTIATTDDDFDHVSLSDGTSLKYQVFDGLCDIKQANDFVTVSYCKFANHDKTSLIGHSSSYTSDLNHQTITLHHNYYYNCKQRLPMVRFATIHIYNNYYLADSNGRGNSYCIGLREQNRVYAENNYFGSGVTPVSNSQGSYYFTGNYGYSDSDSTAAWTPSAWYSYDLDSADDIPTIVTADSGAGVWEVVQ